MTLPIASTDVNLAERIELACLLEATAAKPGNVHPTASFVDLSYQDFVVAARLIGQAMGENSGGVGELVLAAAKAVDEQVSKNVNLGIILLMAPLVVAHRRGGIEQHLDDVLDGLTIEDAKAVYEAIRTMKPGGLSTTPSQDVSQEPTETLLAVMRLAADRDAIAAEYATGFTVVRRNGLPWLEMTSEDFWDDWEQHVTGLFLHLLSSLPDTLISRKTDRQTSYEVTQKATAILDAGWPHTLESQTLQKEFDVYLRADGNSLNPGTTADLVAATLLAGILMGMLPVSAEKVSWFKNVCREKGGQLG